MNFKEKCSNVCTTFFNVRTKHFIKSVFELILSEVKETSVK